ncbi:cytochrome P450 [Neotabrizicola sp. sgz301269]|uniref:cytochrome P450 n=1 Tax=Neotabrizicola sp. sgz301269 TaxID=3276282 RepID=UPI00376FF0D9
MLDLAAFNSLAPILRDDPYPVYAALRAQAPVFWSEGEQAWILLRRAEVSAAFTSPDLLALDLGDYVRKVSRALAQDPEDLLRLLDMALFFRNPPAHAPLRSLVARLMAVRSQASCADAVDRIAQRLIAPLARDGGMDLMRDFAGPLPQLFMGWLLGLAEDEALWLGTTLAGVPVVLNRGCSIRDYNSANLRLEEAHRFLRDRIAQCRRRPAEDGLCLLVARNDTADQPLDDARLAALASFVFLAGFETTSALIGNGLWLLLHEDGQYDRVAADPGLVPGAVNEALRLEPPIQQVRRRAAADQLVADCQIKAGQQLALMIAAANRDPQAYPEPDRFLPGRAGLPVQSFGAGLHHCLGAWVARMEAEAAMRALLGGPRPVLGIERPAWLPHHNQRRMSSLPVAV